LPNGKHCINKVDLSSYVVNESCPLERIPYINWDYDNVLLKSVAYQVYEKIYPVDESTTIKRTSFTTTVIMTGLIIQMTTIKMELLLHVAIVAMYSIQKMQYA